MANYKNGERTKKQLIDYVYNELLTNPVSSLKIRELARKTGYAPSSIYQHFSSLKELIAIASIKFLDEYTFEYSKMLNESKDLIESYLQGWELFCKFAFGRPDIFYHLFWDLGEDDLDEALSKYYAVYPLNAPEAYSVHYYLTFLVGNIVERDYVLVRTMVGQKLVLSDDAHYVSVVTTSIARNLLAECINANEYERKQASERCMELVKHTLYLVLERNKHKKEHSVNNEV